ncbi:unnamed protein product [Schistosoma margrebowiei]|uniref:Uncharacterized protein n=1 Tax=Schistosoma margrebowiei TaxID=48269 RepID=A0A183LR01_9TREM|nr:unnamed protein product [Schistosoma margrebowiei]
MKHKKTTINNSRARTERERVKAQPEYTEVNKQKYVEDLATLVNKTATEGNMEQLYDTTKKLVEKYSKPERAVNDKEGKAITEIQGQRNRWM